MNYSHPIHNPIEYKHQISLQRWKNINQCPMPKAVLLLLRCPVFTLWRFFMLFTVVINFSCTDFFLTIEPSFEGVRPENRLF